MPKLENAGVIARQKWVCTPHYYRRYIGRVEQSRTLLYIRTRPIATFVSRLNDDRFRHHLSESEATLTTKIHGELMSSLA